MDPSLTSLNFIISPSNYKVVYIHSNLFIWMINLQKKILKMHKKSCNQIIKLCDQDLCNTTLVLYFDVSRRDKLNPQSIEKKYYKNVLGFLTVEIYPASYGEIYNVCTSKKSRRVGIMKSVFKSLLIDTPINIIWLGVDINTPMIWAVIHLYVSIGFTPYSKIQTVTPRGKNPGFPFIGLEYNKVNGIPSPRSKGEIRSIESGVRRMINQYIRQQPAIPAECRMNIIIKPELINQIYEYYIKKNREFGGIMGVKSMGNNNYLLGLAAITKGTPAPDFEISLPSYYITWHTHPDICYKENLCYIGWPSGQDMSIMIPRYINGQIAHILFAHEGVYVLQIDPNMMVILKKLPFDCVASLSQLIWFYFSHLEQFRNINYDTERIDCLEELDDFGCLTYDSTQKILSLRKIQEAIGETTLKNLINIEHPNPFINTLMDYTHSCINAVPDDLDINISIFNVKFIATDVAKKNGVTAHLHYSIAPTRSACPIPNYNGSDLNLG